MSADLICYVVAAVCFALKTIGVPTGQFDTIAGGFFFLTLSLIV